jgi:hypothetical protein
MPLQWASFKKRWLSSVIDLTQSSSCKGAMDFQAVDEPEGPREDATLAGLETAGHGVLPI